MCKGDGLCGRGEAPGAVVVKSGSGGIAEGHHRRDFGGGKGAAATGIRQVWQELGKVGGGKHGQIRLRVRPGTLVFWDRDR